MFRIQYKDSKDAIKEGWASSIDLVARAVSELLVMGVTTLRVDSKDALEMAQLDTFGKAVAEGLKSNPKYEYHSDNTDKFYFINQAALEIAARQWAHQLSEEEAKQYAGMDPVQAYREKGPNLIPLELRAWVAAKMSEWNAVGGWDWAEAEINAGAYAEPLAKMWIMSVQGLTGGLATKYRDGDYPRVPGGTAPTWVAHVGQLT